ncbi:hypothetical protein ABK040_005949 [Willaertia magna]
MTRLNGGYNTFEVKVKYEPTSAKENLLGLKTSVLEYLNTNYPNKITIQDRRKKRTGFTIKIETDGTTRPNLNTNFSKNGFVENLYNFLYRNFKNIYFDLVERNMYCQKINHEDHESSYLSRENPKYVFYDHKEENNKMVSQPKNRKENSSTDRAQKYIHYRTNENIENDSEECMMEEAKYISPQSIMDLYLLKTSRETEILRKDNKRLLLKIEELIKVIQQKNEEIFKKGKEILQKDKEIIEKNNIIAQKERAIHLKDVELINIIMA